MSASDGKYLTAYVHTQELVQRLARLSGPPQQRLLNAEAGSCFMRIGMERDGLPQHLADEMSAIRKEMTKAGDLESTAKAMSAAEAQQLIERIVHFVISVSEAHAGVPL